MKNRAGVTLLELIIAIGILAIVTAPIFTLLFSSVRLNAQAHRVTMATFTAQQRMEELVGREWDDDLINENWNLQELYHGFFVSVAHDGDDDLPLLSVTVRVYEHSTSVSPLVQLTNILNVAPHTGF